MLINVCHKSAGRPLFLFRAWEMNPLLHDEKQSGILGVNLESVFDLWPSERRTSRLNTDSTAWFLSNSITAVFWEWMLWKHCHFNSKCKENISGGPLSALTCCVNARLLSAIKKISPLIYSQSWVGSWVYTTQAMMTFTLIF